MIKTEINLGDLYDLSVPGKYAVQVRRYDSESKDEVKSTTVNVTVVP